MRISKRLRSCWMNAKVSYCVIDEESISRLSRQKLRDVGKSLEKGVASSLDLSCSLVSESLCYRVHCGRVKAMSPSFIQKVL